MPTNAYPNSRYADMTTDQVAHEVALMVGRWAQEDAERQARNAALLASLTHAPSTPTL